TAAPLSRDKPERHPGDREPVVDLAEETGAALASLLFATVARRLGSKPTALELDLAAGIFAVQEIEPLRKGLERIFGIAATQHVLDLSSAMARALNQSRTGAVVGLLERAMELRHLHDRRKLWSHWESELCGDPEQFPVDWSSVPPERPEARPAGKVE